MSYFASSASPEVAHWHEEKPGHLMSTSVVANVAQAANEALYSVEREVRELFVTAEHSMEDICDTLGIHPFHHNFFGKLVGCTLRVNEYNHLEIHREGARHVTSFPVQFVAA